MTQAERLASKNYYVEFAASGGGTAPTYTEISGDYTSFDWTAAVEAADMTANNDDSAYEKPLIKRNDYTLSSFYRGVAGTAVDALLVEGTEGTIRWGPEGTAAGKPKGVAPVYVKDYKQSSGNKNSPQTVDVTFGPQGALVSDPRSATW